jgi:hypothetical protein
VSCFNVRRQGDLVMIAGKQAPDFRVSCPLNPSSVVIVGAGASGAAWVRICCGQRDMADPSRWPGDEEQGPVDRPNLSKDFLAGMELWVWTFSTRSNSANTWRGSELPQMLRTLEQKVTCRFTAASSEEKSWVRESPTLPQGFVSPRS